MLHSAETSAEFKELARETFKKLKPYLGETEFEDYWTRTVSITKYGEGSVSIVRDNFNPKIGWIDGAGYRQFISGDKLKVLLTILQLETDLEIVCAYADDLRICKFLERIGLQEYEPYHYSVKLR